MSDSKPYEEQSDAEKIEHFKNELNEWADKHGLAITKISGWTDKKIERMALNNHICCCDKTRICPCEQGLKEIQTESDSMCLCSVFEANPVDGCK